MFFNQAYAGTVPLAASDIASHWDTLYFFLVYLSVFFFILIIGGMIYFIVKYPRSKGAKPRYIAENHLLEGIFIVIPTALLMGIFAWGYIIYHEMAQSPPDSYEIHVLAKQWVWTFQYDSGRATSGEVFVPLNRPVKMIMTSQDVIHSFFVPNFRIKQDVVPGMYTTVWFESKVPGAHQIFCAEYCGTSHSGMLGKVNVLDDEQWKAWLAGKKLGPIPDARDLAENPALRAKILSPNPGDEVATAQAAPIRTSMIEQGRTAFETKGCVSCHSVDGSVKAGPSHKGLFGRMVELSDGTKVLADENYIRESIVKPNAKIVKGYQPIMPTYQGLVSENEMSAIIAYIKSLK